MPRSKLFTRTAAALVAASAIFMVAQKPAYALDLDDLEDLPIRRIVPMPVPTGPVIIIPIEVDDD
jgi:hypothetical protein